MSKYMYIYNMPPEILIVIVLIIVAVVVVFLLLLANVDDEKKKCKYTIDEQGYIRLGDSCETYEEYVRHRKLEPEEAIMNLAQTSPVRTGYLNYRKVIRKDTRFSFKQLKELDDKPDDYCRDSCTYFTLDDVTAMQSYIDEVLDFYKGQEPKMNYPQMLDLPYTYKSEGKLAIDLNLYTILSIQKIQDIEPYINLCIDILIVRPADIRLVNVRTMSITEAIAVLYMYHRSVNKDADLDIRYESPSHSLALPEDDAGIILGTAVISNMIGIMMDIVENVHLLPHDDCDIRELLSTLSDYVLTAGVLEGRTNFQNVHATSVEDPNEESEEDTNEESEEDPLQYVQISLNTSGLLKLSDLVASDLNSMFKATYILEEDASDQYEITLSRAIFQYQINYASPILDINAQPFTLDDVRNILIIYVDKYVFHREGDVFVNRLYVHGHSLYPNEEEFYIRMQNYIILSLGENDEYVTLNTNNITEISEKLTLAINRCRFLTRAFRYLNIIPAFFFTPYQITEEDFSDLTYIGSMYGLIVNPILQHDDGTYKSTDEIELPVGSLSVPLFISDSTSST